MVLTILGLITAAALAVYPYVHRRRVRTRTVHRVRSALALWMVDPAAPLRPTGTAPIVAVGTTPQGPGDSPDLLAPAARRHFVLTQFEIAHYPRRTA